MADQEQIALERLWSGLDTMKERITRLEEQMKTVYNSVERVETKLEKLIEQGHEHDTEISGNKIQIGNGERFFWLVLSAAVGLMIYWVKTG